MPYNLTISWTAASPAPAAGYRIKYWPTSNPSSITTVTPNVSGTTYTITGLTETSYAGTVESACGGGQFSSPVNWSASVAPPTYYYYTGILCGGGVSNSFRSTNPNLADSGFIVRALCAVCGNTDQCFDNISPTATPNTNDVIGVYATCSECTTAESEGVNVSTTEGAICSAPVGAIVYWYGTFGTGVTVYSSLSPLTPLTGYNFIVIPASGVIYNINPSTGVVGAPTGNTC